mmetsp:Transcript_8026/g.13350  ORF Transcript_8026/g.13350 Transcript_8026/m.13350 type:complete len:140 (+) Transcript_8026:170-589(+)|eukprot:CAMPEP_0174969974 /NCGR_PEP_ID=MMETSP0004_2-20121128/9087_1 /TAXON_ID=420556 /ORGANISM="Ochromonas sp., Strain CCMP1393" /LENGTH=139 /DNA_ID=CAMNT_0016219577 /DNA_START=151 /DNA_END=570 /DNA_ORIENTATION=-
MPFLKGDVVLRNIEGMKFTAKIISIDRSVAEVDLEYLDDGNIERYVSLNDLEEIADKDEKQAAMSAAAAGSYNKIDHLPKPLKGLVEDDWESRKAHIPTVYVHEGTMDEESKSAPILLNGAENRLAAGGGLRALRYLRK